jgi:hypothetical protein
MKRIILMAVFYGSVLSSLGAIWQFDLGGKAGDGIMAGNEVDSLPDSFATGRELPFNEIPGILYDDVAKTLEFHVGWGSHEVVQGLPLGGQYISSALYGPAGPNENSPNALYSFTLDSGYRPANDPSGRTGFVDSRITLIPIGGYTVAAQQADLLNSLWYFNIVTTAYETGEIRAQLLAGIPEPVHSVPLSALVLLATAVLWRNQKKSQLPS